MKTKEIKEMTVQERYERLKELCARYSDLALLDLLNGYTPDEGWVRQARVAFNLLKNVDKMRGVELIGRRVYLNVRVL